MRFSDPARSNARTWIRSVCGGFIRLFLDAGAPVAGLLSIESARRMMPAHARRLLTTFAAENQVRESPLAEMLSRRELEVLRLLADRLSSQEIAVAFPWRRAVFYY
jgi:LuxR family maltose regulon positive regulatory protein